MCTLATIAYSTSCLITTHPVIRVMSNPKNNPQLCPGVLQSSSQLVREYGFLMNTCTTVHPRVVVRDL